MERLDEHLYSWASELEPETLEQARTLARLPVLAGHVALMPDAHLGIGTTVGTVIPTKGAIIPAAIGVDIGCGMIAARTSFTGSQLPDTLTPFVAAMEGVVPAGLGKWHGQPKDAALAWWSEHQSDPGSELTHKQIQKLLVQLGTLGSGNHFFEVALDEQDHVWVLMHSGSRGIGNQLADKHIKTARSVCDFDFLSLRGLKQDQDLAWLEEGTPEFERYVRDMLFGQAYAMQNRSMMMDAALEWFFGWMGTGHEMERVNCHHNFSQLEDHDGMKVWVTRKGAIRAGRDDLGLIPGSMGQRSYVIRGRGNPDAYESCAHGAGRRLSRRKARETLSIDSLTQAMEGRAWQAESAEALLDEHPQAYKDIDRVMADQADLVEVIHTLRGIANYKGVS